jgi:hypothetical protein
LQANVVGGTTKDTLHAYEDIAAFTFFEAFAAFMFLSALKMVQQFEDLS